MITNNLEYGIYGRPIFWHLFAYFQAMFERQIIKEIAAARKSGEWVPHETSSAYFLWLSKWEFRFRNLRDVVPDSQFRL